jgi:hypothetical protein
MVYSRAFHPVGAACHNLCMPVNTRSRVPRGGTAWVQVSEDRNLLISALRCFGGRVGARDWPETLGMPIIWHAATWCRGVAWASNQEWQHRYQCLQCHPDLFAQARRSDYSSLRESYCGLQLMRSVVLVFAAHRRWYHQVVKKTFEVQLMGVENNTGGVWSRRRGGSPQTSGRHKSVVFSHECAQPCYITFVYASLQSVGRGVHLISSCGAPCIHTCTIILWLRSYR